MFLIRPSTKIAQTFPIPNKMASMAKKKKNLQTTSPSELLSQNSKYFHAGPLPKLPKQFHSASFKSPCDSVPFINALYSGNP